MLFEVTIPGRPIVKKNTKKFGRGKVYYSPQYMAWEEQALLYLALALKSPKFIERFPIKYPVKVQYVFTFKNKICGDVSNYIEGPQDALVKAGILKDDRLIQFLKAEKKVKEGQESVYMSIEMA